MPPAQSTRSTRSAIRTSAGTGAPSSASPGARQARRGHSCQGHRSSRSLSAANPATARPPRPSHRRLSPAAVPVVAFGDVHGCASLLERELEQHYGSGAELIFLGDLIDRAPEAHGERKVLERIWALQQQPGLWGLSAVTVLRGNHEQMLLDALHEEEPDAATEAWLWNGGNPALLPFVREHMAWFEALPLTAIRGRTLFVHAGVQPGVPLDRQDPDDLIWIRQPFLSQPHGLPYTVVHGHTITRGHRIERHPHRINLDSGAFRSGVLSSLRLDPLQQTRT